MLRRVCGLALLALAGAALPAQAQTTREWKFAKALLSDEVIKKGIEGTFGNLPPRAVKAGDNWSDEVTIPFGPLGSFKAVNDYTYKERDKDGVVITYKSKMTYVAPKGEGAF